MKIQINKSKNVSYATFIEGLIAKKTNGLFIRFPSEAIKEIGLQCFEEGARGKSRGVLAWQ